jgi:hypothetical protein
MKYKTGPITEMVLLLPAEKRNEKVEMLITSSLKNFFGTRYQVENELFNRKLKRYLLLLLAGITSMLLNTYLAFISKSTFPFIALRVLLEPAGWFMMWAGMDFLLYDAKLLKTERHFFKQLSETTIHFFNAA